MYLVAYDRGMRAVAWLAGLLLTAPISSAAADVSKLRKEDVPLEPKVAVRGKHKLCCGYPLAEDLGFALRYYWLSLESDYEDPQGDAVPRSGRGTFVSLATWVELYTKSGLFFGRVPEQFAWSLRMEGSGLMSDGRVINYTGACNYGYGTCFDQLNTKEYPFGRGAGTRPLIPFKSVAVDPRIVAIGEPLYLPELDGIPLPDGSIHDGCVRADDTGGGIKKRKMDLFVVTYGNFRFLLGQLLGVNWITPHIEAPRCEYMRDH